MKETIIVIGGEGFVGHALIRKFYETTNYNLISLDCSLTGKSIIRINSDRVVYIKTNLSNDGNTQSILKRLVESNLNIKCILHFGEYSRGVPSIENINTVINSNVHLTIDVINLCRMHEIRLIYSASSTKFDSFTRDKAPYPYFKNLMVETIKRFGEWFKLKYNICYFYNVFGPGQVETGEYSTVIGIWENEYRNNKPIRVIGDGSQSRDFTHIDDIVNGLILTFNKGVTRHEYHLGTGKSTKIIDIAKMFNTEIEFTPTINCERKSGEAPIENNLARTELGWVPKHNIIEYVDSIINKGGSNKG